MIKFKYVYSHEKIYFKYLVLSIMAAIYGSIEIFKQNGQPINLDSIMEMFIIFMLTINVYWFFHLKSRSNEKKNMKKDVSTEEEKGVYILPKSLLIIGFVKANVAWEIFYKGLGSFRDFKYINMTNIEFIDINKVVLKRKEVKVYFKDEGTILRVHLNRYCKSPYKVAKQVAYNASRCNISFLIEDKNTMKKFTSMQLLDHLESFTYYNKAGEVVEEDGTAYSTKEGIKLIEDILGNINSRLG